MKDYERKIKNQAKKEVKNFDQWYKANELKFINSKIYPSYYATKQLEKPTLRKGWWYACAVFGLFLVLVICFFYPVNIINNKIFLEENIFNPITSTNNVLYEEKIFYEYEILVGAEMGFSLSYDQMNSFYCKIEGDDIFLYGVRQEVKTKQDKYYLTIYFPQRDNSLKNNKDFRDLDDEFSTSKYTIFYNVTKLADGTYLYNMKVTRKNYDTTCYLVVKCTYNKLGDFISAVLK